MYAGPPKRTARTSEHGGTFEQECRGHRKPRPVQSARDKGRPRASFMLYLILPFPVGHPEARPMTRQRHPNKAVKKVLG
ncbi:hypothetical protein Deipe_1258 [Deinococcus peraridilitoris DSM 19664]|uniref:Uncharacterized protein n=1 Tax=Deinococcus peraridilitoris (strain DSM 19664 / LMG 22246 / CIP 109416 / KR-200) TaxID=937777 RepID=K9ZYT0_DEIPD|nr:hypothetical protein Deipe_1258 [Deinococcus peraridilitoris DSM 19664]